jgi:hypothetical protein
LLSQFRHCENPGESRGTKQSSFGRGRPGLLQLHSQ